MSSYHTSFNYLGVNSKSKNLIVAHFDPDNGEQDTYLNLEPVYTNNAYGTYRYDYGAKYGSVSVFKIHLIKKDKGDFTVTDIRDCLRWLTGTTTNSELDLLVGDQIQYTFIGRITNAWNYKMDSRIIGLILEFTSISPFAFSTIQTVSHTINGEASLQINCPSDDLYSFVYLQTEYTNKSGSSLTIENITTNEKTTITSLAVNETITISDNAMIASDKPSKTFGNTFNFVFPRLVSGVNALNIKANGDIVFKYRYPIKIGNLAIDTDSLDGAFECTVDGYIYWNNILEKPTTIAGYGITDAYTKTEIDAKVKTINNTITTTKKTLDNKINTTKVELDERIDGLEDSINDIGVKMTTVYKYKGSIASSLKLPKTGMSIGDVYNLEDTGMNVAWDGTKWDNLGSIVDLSSYATKDEVSQYININSTELNTMLAEVLA